MIFNNNHYIQFMNDEKNSNNRNYFRAILERKKFKYTIAQAIKTENRKPMPYNYHTTIFQSINIPLV